MTLDKFDKLLRTLAGGCALLAGSTYAGFVPPLAAVILGFVAAVFAYLSGSPLFDPTLVGKSPWVSRALITVAGLCGAAAASSFFPAVQGLFAADHARKLAAGLTLVGAVCTFLSQSPIIAGGTGPGAPTKLGLVFAFVFLPGLSGCATVTPIVKDIETCAGPDCADIATKILPAAEVILECELATGGIALPACAENGLAALAAAAGPDGWKIVACVVNAIEKDTTKPPAVRARARMARPVVAMHRALNR